MYKMLDKEYWRCSMEKGFHILLFKQISLAARLIVCSIMLFPQAGWSNMKTAEGANADGQPSTSLISRATNPFPELEIPLTSETPKVDGSLNDAAWQNPPLPLGEWLTYNPIYGSKIAQRTQVWAVYDKNGLYFAFYCKDPEPDKIKSSISRRDMIWKDDWVGLSLDSLGSHQSSYEFFVNPDGIQADIMNTTMTGQDTAPDWVWESAAKRKGDGYMVEMRIPFTTIRFSSGIEVRMEILFWRRVSRLGMSVSWPDLPPGKSIFTRRAPMLLHDVSRPLTLEVIPNITFSLNQTLALPDHWTSYSHRDAGLTVKYGLTSSVTLDGTFRPDFSQVESDAFQMEVNQRYPVFYSEKRPFFMEGMSTFDLAGVGGDSNMRTAVHTRRIVDPQFGAKITGTVGKTTFASIFALDDAPGNVDASNLLYQKKKYFNVVRMLYSLGKGTYIGSLVTDTKLGAGRNRALAADMSLQLGAHQQFRASAITTSTQDFDGRSSRKGMAGQVHYAYVSKRQTFSSQFEHYDKDFQMDTAFYNRTGITTNWTYYSLNFYPDERRYSWFKKFSPFVWIHAGRDRIQGGNEHFLLGGIQMNFTRQGFLRMDFGEGTEAWAGRVFGSGKTRMTGSAQIFCWLNFSAQMNFLRSIYYDPIAPFSGNVRDFHIESTFQPSSRLNLTVSYDRTTFDRASNGNRIYAVNIVNTKISYQFNKSFYVRAIERYDDSRKRVLMDYLASFELVPGTVAHAGYGALFEKESASEPLLVSKPSSYINTQRGLFFKVSYRYLF
jgi:hypothetical protein